MNARDGTRRAFGALAFAWVVGVVGCGGAAAGWPEVAQRECGEPPALPDDDAGRWDEAASCWVTPAVAEACRAHPPEAEARLGPPRQCGGVEPPMCHEVREDYLRHHRRIPCECTTRRAREDCSTMP